MVEQKPRKHPARANKGGRPRKHEIRPHFETALDYAMHVINDSKVTARRRDTLAMAVLRYGYQAPTSRASTEQPTGKKAAANIEAQTAHEDTDWKGLVN